MKGLARTGGSGENVTTMPLPTIATGGQARQLGGAAANDNRMSMARRMLPGTLFLASVIFLLLAI